MRTVWAQAALLAGIAWLTAGPSAQSLGDVARRQADRQAGVAGKKYTNEDLGPVPESAPAPATTAAAAAATSATATPVAPKGGANAAPAGEGEAATAPPKPVEKRDEKYWRERAATLRSRVADIRARTKAAEQRLKEMDDALANGAGSSHAQERLVALKALEDVQSDARFMQEEVSRMENRARAANVPPEWLR